MTNQSEGARDSTNQSLPACNAQRYKKRGAFISRPFVCTTQQTRTQQTRTNTSSSSFFIHSSDPVKHATIVRHQIGRKQATSKCMHRNITAAKHQECDAVLTANGRQRALQRTVVRQPRGTMFVHKVRELDVLRPQSVRIEVVAAPLGINVHGDPVFSRSIGVVCVAHDRRRVRVDDLRQTVFGNDVVRAAHQRVVRQQVRYLVRLHQWS